MSIESEESEKTKLPAPDGTPRDVSAEKSPQLPAEQKPEPPPCRSGQHR